MDNLQNWIGIKSGDKINLVNVDLSHSPVLCAEKIHVKYLQKEETSHADLVIRWLKSNVFTSKSTNFVVYENVQIFFNVEVLNSESNLLNLYRYDGVETKFEIIRSAATAPKAIIDGLELQFSELVNLANALFSPDEIYDKFNIKLPRGVLLHGPPGCGKTMLVRYVSEYLNVPVLQLHPSDFSSDGFGDSEAKLLKIYDSAKALSPCIIFMDEIDSLCPKRDSNQNSSSQRVTTLLLTIMDGCINMKQKHKIFFIGATNMPSSIDSALRRPGRFDREIEIYPPTSSERFSILKTLLNSYPNGVNDEELHNIAESSHGFVGSDLSLLCKESFINALKLQKNNYVVNFDHIRSALAKIRPSAMREVFIEVPNVKWTDIGGQSLTKQKLVESVEWPIKVIYIDEAQFR
jgi:SpoVK/Ycf46/Vps4 family AAA+-type ATPase